MPGDVGGLLPVGQVPAAHLLLQRLHRGRHQATQAQLGAFLLGEGGALVRQWILQHPHAGILIDAHDLSLLFRYDRAAAPPGVGRAVRGLPAEPVVLAAQSARRTHARIPTCSPASSTTVAPTYSPVAGVSTRVPLQESRTELRSSRGGNLMARLGESEDSASRIDLKRSGTLS
jgi:hypothetical protein